MAAPLIAVIEDDQGVLQILDLLLRDAGYQVISYPLGRNAHQFVLRTLPDLIILDLWLEHANAGSMVLAMLENDPSTRQIPVIICSAHVSALENLATPLHEKGYMLLAKPFEPEELFLKIRAALDNVAKNDRPSRNTPGTR